MRTAFDKLERTRRFMRRLNYVLTGGMIGFAAGEFCTGRYGMGTYFAAVAALQIWSAYGYPRRVPPKCQHCGERLWPFDPVGRMVTPTLHLECEARMIMGSLAHQRKQCQCYGGTGEDDPKLSTRENARRACREFMRRGAGGENN